MDPDRKSIDRGFDRVKALARFSLGLLLASLILVSTKAQAQNITRTITLRWDASASDNVAGYRVYFGQQGGNYSHMIDAGNSTSGEIPNLVEGTTYYFTVTAYDWNGEESTPSEEFHYTPNPALILNISARAMVQSGDGVMIAGFIVGGLGEKKVVVRALGPTLATAGVKGTLGDPSLELRGPNGLISANDNWRDGSPGELEALGLAPRNDAEAATIAILKPGNYSVIVASKKAKTGLALVEVYDVGTPSP